MSEEKKPYRIGVAGLGTVGTGVVKVFQQNGDLLEQRAGRPVEIVSVTASNKNKDRGVDLSTYDWAETLDEMANDPRLDAIVELIGGSEGATKELVEKALAQGKDVITANKALLAHHGYELAKLAEKNMVTLAYEAAVAGGIPIIKTLREGLSANQIESLYGILNGTCNYILTKMRETGRDFDDVLKEADSLIEELGIPKNKNRLDQVLGVAQLDLAFNIESLSINSVINLSIIVFLIILLLVDFSILYKHNNIHPHRVGHHHLKIGAFIVVAMFILAASGVGSVLDGIQI